MAYGKRLYMTFDDDYEGTEWLVEIYENGYAGAATEMDAMGSTPVQMRWVGSKWKNIVGCEADITLLSSEDLSWLNTADGRGIKVLIYKDSALFYSGFALPDTFTDSLGTYPREYVFTVTDQIGLLDSIEYVDGSGDPYEDYERGLIICARVLAKTGLSLNINSACNIYEDGMSSSASSDPIYQVYFRQDSIMDDELNPGSCYQMLDRILKTFQVRLFQAEGEWWLFRIPEQQSYPWEYRE